MASLSPLSNRLLREFNDKLGDDEKKLQQGEILFVLRRNAAKRDNAKIYGSNLDNLNERLKEVYRKYVLYARLQFQSFAF